MTLEKKKIKSFETNCAYFLMLLIIRDERLQNDSSKNVNSSETNCDYDIWKTALKKNIYVINMLDDK